MKRIATLVACLALAVPALAQDTKTDLPPIVSISAKGDDVRAVIHDLFTQQQKNYVLDPNVRMALYLSLKDVEFEEALMIVCKSASLKYEVQNGIFYISKAPAKQATPVNPQPKAADKPTPEAKPQVEVKPAEPERPKGILPGAAFQKRVTTKLSKADIREVFAELARQTGVTIEIDKSVPNYKLDAFLNDTSLKFAIDAINERTGLQYKLTNFRSILIFLPPKDTDTRVQVISEGPGK